MLKILGGGILMFFVLIEKLANRFQPPSPPARVVMYAEHPMIDTTYRTLLPSEDEWELFESEIQHA